MIPHMIDAYAAGRQEEALRRADAARQRRTSRERRGHGIARVAVARRLMTVAKRLDPAVPAPAVSRSLRSRA